MSRHRRLLLASLTGSERRGKLHPERPASCRRSVVSSDRRLLLASLTGGERRGKLHPERPASWPAMDIVASARPSYLRRGTGVYIILMMDDTKPMRSSLSSRKEGTARLHWASGLWNGSPRYLGGLGQSPARFLPRFPWRRQAM